LVVIL